MIKDASSNWIESVWLLNSSKIYKLCEKKCSSVEDAKDLFQTVALKFCQNARFLRERNSVYPWLLRVVHNTHCDMIEKDSQVFMESRLKCLPESLDCLAEERSVFYNPRESNLNDYDKLLSILTPLERMIVEMTYVGGFSSEELSSVIGLSALSIRKRRCFAVSKLREKLSKYK